MSNVSTLVKTGLVTLVLAIEGANRDGLKAGGQWFNYGTTFKGDKLTREAVGRTAKITLVDAQDGKRYVRAVELEAAKAAVEPVAETDVIELAPTAPADAPSPQALAYAQDLAKQAGLADEEVAEIVRLRFKKEPGAVSKGECSLLITFLGGYRPMARKRFRS
jgi:hypothetical protein